MIKYIVVLVTTCLYACAPIVQGPPGIPGPPGLSIVSTAVPDSQNLCPNGGNVLLMAQDALGTGVWDPTDPDQTSVLICDGQVGATGNTGATGAQGPSGTNSTPLTVVQLCPGFTPSYPNTFPEVGFCLSSRLYGIYSENGGFMVYLPPGTYSSNGINASCTLTVAANCVVTKD
jgi:hypothetical protein